MDTKQSILIELAKERERLILQIAELNKEVGLIERMITRKSSEDADVTKGYSWVTKFSALKPQKALEKIFKENQTRNFLPSQLSLELSRMAKQGELITQSKMLLNVVHTGLKALVKKGLIIKQAELDPPRYRWKSEVTEIVEEDKNKED